MKKHFVSFLTVFLVSRVFSLQTYTEIKSDDQFREALNDYGYMGSIIAYQTKDCHHSQEMRVNKVIYQ
jgi:hypothetical protein